jgi:hypothetical protein
MLPLLALPTAAPGGSVPGASAGKLRRADRGAVDQDAALADEVSRAAISSARYALSYQDDNEAQVDEDEWYDMLADALVSVKGALERKGSKSTTREELRALVVELESALLRFPLA